VRVVAGRPPAIDGRLDDPVWSQANVATGFVQYNPRPGAPASQSTEVRLLYDGDALYVGMRMYDTNPESIAGRLARRDLTGAFTDWAQVIKEADGEQRLWGINFLRDIARYKERSYWSPEIPELPGQVSQTISPSTHAASGVRRRGARPDRRSSPTFRT
jgi:Carbohydrate family 9 binding domain-like